MCIVHDVSSGRLCRLLEFNDYSVFMFAVVMSVPRLSSLHWHSLLLGSVTDKKLKGSVKEPNISIYFFFSTHHSMAFYFRCSVYWWKGCVSDFSVLKYY